MKLALSITCAFGLLTLTSCGDSGTAPPTASDVATTPPATAPAGTTGAPHQPSPAPVEHRPQSGHEPGPPPSSDTALVELDDPMAGQKELASLPEAFYGSWRLTGSGGGFDGHADPPPNDGEMIVITKANRIESWKGGKLVSTVPFRITRGRSIFGNDNWLIYRGGIGLHVIRLQGTDALDISENHVECQSWSYARVPRTSTGG